MAQDYDYAQLIDDFELGADVGPDESLTDYIERRRREFESKADGGSIGIEVLFTDKMKDGGRVGMLSGGALKAFGSGIMKVFSKGDDAVDLAKQEEIFRSGNITTDFLENVDDKVIEKFIRTRDTKGVGGYGMYDNFADMPNGLKAAELISRIKTADGGINYEAAELFIGKKLKGDETVDELIKMVITEKKADGGRVGLFMGGDPLTGQALSIYESMNSYGFSDQEIADSLKARGLYDVTSTTTPVINTTTPIINQGGGGGGEPPSGPSYSRDDDLGTSDYQGPGPGFFESILGIPAALVSAYVKNSPVINFAKSIFKPRVETFYTRPNLDAIAKEKERQEKERADFLAAAQRTGIASQLGGPDGTSGGKYAGGKAFASANPYGGSGTDDDMGADSFLKDGGLATRFKPRRR